MTPIDSKRTSPSPLQEVVEENKQVVEDIREAVDDLTAVHAVLTVEAEKTRLTPEAEKAVKRTKVVRTNLADTAVKLEDATEVLRQHASNSTQQ